MNEWMIDLEWRRKVKGKNIYLMRNHNYAFSAWEIERLRKNLKLNAVLVHVDSHLDDIAESIEIPGILEDIKTEEIAIILSKQYDRTKVELSDRIYMNIDNFIWPAIIRNTIGHVYHISDDPQEETNEINLRRQISDPDFNYNNRLAERQFMNLAENCKKIVRYQSIEEFGRGKEDFLRNIRGKSVIFDLDLDYFNDSNVYNSNPKIRNEIQIIKNMQCLKNLIEWDLITVALSPEYCGGEEACKYLLQLLFECFEIDEKELIEW